jgi:hypothetical protein
MERTSTLLCLSGCAVIVGASIVGATACGGKTGDTPSDASPDGGATWHGATQDALTEFDAATEGGGYKEAGRDGDAASEDAASEDADAADASPSCTDLANMARAQFGPILQQNESCQTDPECETIALAPSGSCVAPCGVEVSEAGAAMVATLAASLCQPFLEAGCPPFALGCPAAARTICAGGTCAGYKIQASGVPTMMTHGVCYTFDVSYIAFGGKPQAPHDLVATVSAANATLYSDTSCTNRLPAESVTIPAGATNVAVGIVPTSAGSASITVEGVTWSFSAD